MTLKVSLIISFVAAVSFALFHCTSSLAAEQSTDKSFQNLGYLQTDPEDFNSPEQTFTSTLVISAPGAVWVSDQHPLISLTSGSLIVIAGKQPVTMKTAVGEVTIPAGLAAMVQQEDNCPLRICMIGVRGKVADFDNDDWNIIVNSNDDSCYKLGFGDVLLSSSDKDNSDLVVIHQPPAACELIREAAHQLHSIALALNVNGVLLADKIANDCTSVLLALGKGNTVGTAEQLQNPVRIFVDDGTKFVAVQANPVHIPAAFNPPHSLPKASTLVAASKK